MEPTATGVLYAAEHLLEGAVALVKGITHPTLPVKANLTHITTVPLPRSLHTVSVIKGRAYIFGGEVEPGKLADNTMHVVILPSSGVLEADYTTFAARAGNGYDDVPSPRKGHTAVAIGDSIYVFGGEGDRMPDEKGRVWVYSSVSNTWSYLEPTSGTSFPGQRTGHASTSSDLPGPKTTTYREKAPQTPADPAQFVPEPAEADSWGTIFVLGGRDTATNELMYDALAFDVRTRTWTNIPSPPGSAQDGASLSLVGELLYRFGGKGGGSSGTASTQCLDVSHVWQHAEGGTTPLTTGWA
ncbi:galactose oxidase [Plenodomus tracheiphilus IPT5]|uniref:Galactose oxidase n=1 Tax=Plenodomus tracheiphilus IPT5 TaxID=1408161 RepID=A0A6A7BBD1_9PLEO|nr:galactose oxidase [Plenodomus tracheiphilus IPT5]